MEKFFGMFPTAGGCQDYIHIEESHFDIAGPWVKLTNALAHA